ncbi:NAD(P)/FAD-dependent oxidoreductase [Magnetospirillum molischianum]|uniref:NAD binding site:FAD dependent oxidoreductase n=1 Tax=Magnetospirillum molischianum DSM 120 TaxID=1150626 RepID=H8FUP1_MAGML|nr:NAD(P)/FAD-dependent oxidoreductase [Magnetospirillum molischianum]CCG42079.1 NAD binding site:FAD dependent oxidoreductase [Magnetospirillum molischianum DSM 120]
MLAEQGAEPVDCVVIGAGVVGLAAARGLALAGRDVIVLEAEGAIGTGISSRNSEVIHAGLYYTPGSLKARLCVEGSRAMRAHATRCGIPHALPGKLVVATDTNEEETLATVFERARTNGAEGLRMLSATEARALEPDLVCTAALLSPFTGIIDSHAFMLSLQGEAEAAGAMIAFHAPVTGGRADGDSMLIETGGVEPMRLRARSVVVSAGLAAPRIGAALGLRDVPPASLCRGNYFSLIGRVPFSRLVYPVPVSAGLGVHFTLDLGGAGRFGPDVEWIEREEYNVDPTRGDVFYDAIRRYWPGLPDGALAPAYCGIRPKIQAPGEPERDFLIHGPTETGAPGVVALYGIESPGLTASLAIADHVVEMLS